jgi:uncharacterized protein YggE
MEDKKEKQYKIGIIIAVVLVVILLIGGGGGDQKLVLQENQTINVTGETERFVVPDTALVSFTMTRRSASLEEATNSVNERIESMLDDLNEQDIQERDIKTTGYNVYPEYNYNERTQEFIGYRVSQTVEIKIRELDQANTILSKISSYQVDNVSGLTFYVEEDEEIYDQLRKDAIDDAKDKAQQLARDLGVSLDEIVGFNESGNNNYPMPMYDMAVSESADGGRVSLPTGENRFSSNVTITYTLKGK